ncbi:MAG: hypothetical protein LBL47_00875 [Lactobacillus sp.]|jgi:hypothetical protein|nr:hypothetical protein [Lactobacillus sp.]
MRGLLILTLGIFAFTATARADDDVFVDMSVLNSLGAPVIRQNQPKFPIINKEDVVKPKPRPKAKKAAPKKEKTVVNKVETKPVVQVKEDLIVIPAKPKETLPVVAEPVVEPFIAVKENKPVIQEAPVVEESIELSVISSFNNEEAKAEPEDIERAAIADAEEKVVEPLIPATSATPAVDTRLDTHKIYFADEDTELTDVKKSLLDSIVATFVNPQTNKIAIYSYNYDNGEDSFKKKRQSLNRAVDVRSYLLSKGFKNFSIKVINITDDESKKGVVEIEEIK